MQLKAAEEQLRKERTTLDAKNAIDSEKTSLEKALAEKEALVMDLCKEKETLRKTTDEFEEKKRLEMESLESLYKDSCDQLQKLLNQVCK